LITGYMNSLVTKKLCPYIKENLHVNRITDSKSNIKATVLHMTVSSAVDVLLDLHFAVFKHKIVKKRIEYVTYMKIWLIVDKDQIF